MSLAPLFHCIVQPITYLNNLCQTENRSTTDQAWEWYFQAVPELSAQLPIPILGIMLLIWQLRDKDLQEKFPLDTKESRIDFIAWCVVCGRHEYQALKEATLFWDAVSQPAQIDIETNSPHDPINALSWLIVLVARGRPDLGFDVSSRQGRNQLLSWYILNGRTELALSDIAFSDWQMSYFLAPSETPKLNHLQELIYQHHPNLQSLFPYPSALQDYQRWFSHFCLTLETDETLDQPAQFSDILLSEDDPAWAISKRMQLALQTRDDLPFDAAKRQGRQQLLAWYLQHGRIELGQQHLPFKDWQLDFFQSPSQRQGLNCLQALIYETRPDVQQAFPLPQALDGYLHWFEHFISIETRLIDDLTLRRDKDRPNEPSPFGVNIIGYVFGQLGIGEDARMAAKSFLTTDIPITLIDFPPGSDTSQADQSMAQYVSRYPQYAINLFCLPALEQARCFAERGKRLFEGRYNIGYWPWELPSWPENWQHLFSLVNEVWSSSPYTLNALRPVSPIPVKLMPMAVEIPAVSALTRKDFGLPERATLFLFAFDLNSSMTRKNPEACLSAFLEAFPYQVDNTLDRKQVGLVIKIHPPKTPNKSWDKLKKLQQNDPRIHLIEQTLTKPDLLALYKLCDCFISLHRAEGFGRCIAEAMLLGKPVITTGFSGNLAFTSHESALLVDYKHINLERNDYPYGDGQQWAEPDISHAAIQMQKLVNDPKFVDRLSNAGQKTILSSHNAETVGIRYAENLKLDTK